MAVMLNMTDSADGHPRRVSIHYPLYNQTVALSVSVGLLWHVSCVLPFLQNMSTVVISAEFELLFFWVSYGRAAKKLIVI
jgi:hypothetical protein